MDNKSNRDASEGAVEEEEGVAFPANHADAERGEREEDTAPPLGDIAKSFYFDSPGPEVGVTLLIPKGIPARFFPRHRGSPSNCQKTRARASPSRREGEARQGI